MNTWISEEMRRDARLLSANHAATEGQLERMLFKIEEEANHCYEMWKNSL
jgi:hypothetical protein